VRKAYIRCCSCGKKIPVGGAYPAYNHPEAPPVCFDCLPENAKKILKTQIRVINCSHKKTVAMNEEGHAGVYCVDCGEKLEDGC